MEEPSLAYAAKPALVNAPLLGQFMEPLPLMLVSLDGGGPLALQLYRALRSAILGGALPPDARLPSTRALAIDVGVSRNTALLAYAQLFAEGYVTGRRGSGTYVRGELPDAMTAVS